MRPDEGFQARVTLPLQVMPLPVPALGRTLIEQFFDPRHITRQPFPARECNVAQVELRFGLAPSLGLIAPSELCVLVGLSLSLACAFYQRGPNRQSDNRRCQQSGRPGDQRFMTTRPAPPPPAPRPAVGPR